MAAAAAGGVRAHARAAAVSPPYTRRATACWCISVGREEGPRVSGWPVRHRNARENASTRADREGAGPLPGPLPAVSSWLGGGVYLLGGRGRFHCQLPGRSERLPLIGHTPINNPPMRCTLSPLALLPSPHASHRIPIPPPHHPPPTPPLCALPLLYMSPSAPHIYPLTLRARKLADRGSGSALDSDLSASLNRKFRSFRFCITWVDDLRHRQRPVSTAAAAAVAATFHTVRWGPRCTVRCPSAYLPPPRHPSLSPSNLRDTRSGLRPQAFSPTSKGLRAKGCEAVFELGWFVLGWLTRGRPRPRISSCRPWEARRGQCLSHERQWENTRQRQCLT